MIWLSLIPLFIIIFYLVTCYNRLVTDKHRVLSGWSDIEVQLKRRHDLIPKLVEAIRQYAGYEQATLQAVVELRNAAGKQHEVDARAGLENKLSISLFSVYGLVENYPDLKSNKNYLDLQQQITAIEQDIHFARRYFNGAVNNLNTRIETFPDLIVARLFNFRPASYFELEETSP